MLFNFGKCKCLHTRHGNGDAQYAKGGTVLSITVKKKDLELTISADTKVSEHCAAAKGNQILGLIMRNIVYKEKRTNNTAVQYNSKTSFRIVYTRMEAISQEGY